MTRPNLNRFAMAACAVAVAAPLAAQAQVYPLYPQQMPGPPAGMPERVFSYEGTPVFTPGDEFGGAAMRNNRESRQYEALVRSSPDFRARRMEQECGSIADPRGRDQCLSTFGDGEP